MKYPKEKAKELLDKFSALVGIEAAKACALLSCEIILKDVGAEDWEEDTGTGGNYWEQVKEELNLSGTNS